MVEFLMGVFCLVQLLLLLLLLSRATARIHPPAIWQASGRDVPQHSNESTRASGTVFSGRVAIAEKN